MPTDDVRAHYLKVERDLRRRAEIAQLLLDAARSLTETLEIDRVYDRFHELLADVIPHDGVIVSSFDERESLITCEYASVEGNRIDPATLPPLKLSASGGMQSEVIRTGEPLLANDVAERVESSEGTFYDVDREGTVRKVPDLGPTRVQSAMMVPVKHAGRVVGVVQLMSDQGPYSPDDLELVEGLVAQMSAAVRTARLHEERRRAEAAEAAARAAAEQREEAARLLEAVGDGVFYVSPEGIVRFWNRSAELVLGLSGDDVRERPAAEAVPGWQAIAEQVPVAEDDGVPQAATLPIDVDRRELWLSFVAVRISAGGVVYAFRDQTAEHKLDAAQSDFIATVSHELRTPMTAVYGAARTLLRSDVDLAADESRTLLEMIAIQSERLAQITEEVLLASRLDSGTVTVEQEQVDIAEITRETIAAMERHLDPRVSFELTLPAFEYVTGDRDRIRQIVTNLVDNAAKYSREGGRITVSVEKHDGHVRLSVADQGFGIPTAEQEAIFEKFYRVDPEQTQGGGGTGLGLYISRELARRMNGEIFVDSEPSRGSTFVLELPRG
jgi:two-component system, OmpR family, phosphate regulon sensor histidine kinase PhoR